MKELHPGARWLFRLRAYSPLIGITIFMFYFTVDVFNALREKIPDALMQGIIMSTVVTLLVIALVIIIIGEIYARLAYRFWLYDITEECIKIEKGIVWKKYISIPYERIQNVDINRGVIARIMGFSSIEIETAGQSGFVQRKKRHHSEGYLPAVDIMHAEEIRDAIVKRIKGQGM